MKTLAAIFRASKSLSFTNVTKYATRELERLYFSDLARTKADSDRTRTLTEMVVVARQMGSHNIFKRVLYDLLRTPTFGLMCIADEEGCLIKGTDLLMLVTARESLQSQWATQMTTAMSASSDCAKPGNVECLPLSLSEDAWRVLIVESGIFADGFADPMAAFDRIDVLDFSTSQGCCEKCAGSWKMTFRARKQNLWMSLDKTLSLSVA